MPQLCEMSLFKSQVIDGQQSYYALEDIILQADVDEFSPKADLPTSSKLMAFREVKFKRQR